MKLVSVLPIIQVDLVYINITTLYIKGGYINESVHVNSRCYRITSDKCDYISTCYNTTIVRLKNAELAYYITIESGKQTELYNCLTSYIEDNTYVIWCKDGEHVDFNGTYIECPSIKTLLAHYNANEIVSLNQVEPSSCK